MANKASDTNSNSMSPGEIKILILKQSSFSGPKFTVGRQEFGYILNAAGKVLFRLIKKVYEFISKCCKFK